MLSIFDSIRGIDFWSVLCKMVLAFLLGAAVGLERSAKNRPAGFRTHILVCVGATIASLTGHYIYLGLAVPSDLTRIGAQVIAGLGFIGAGTIIVTRRQTVKGLTTAAGLWATGIVGLTIGAGFYEGGLIGTALILIAEIFFSQLSPHIRRVPEFDMVVAYSEKESLDHVMRCCKDHNIAIVNLRIVKEHETEDSFYHAQLSLRANSNIDPESFLEYVQAISGVFDASIKK